LNQDILATVPKVANDPYWSNRANWTKIAIYYKSDRRRNGLSYDAAAGSSSRSLQVIKQDGETLNVKYVVIFNTSKKYLVIRPTDVDMNYASIYIRPTETPATPDASGIVLGVTGLSSSAATITFTPAVDGGKPDTPQDALLYKVVRSTSSAAIDTVAEADGVTGSNLIMDYTRMNFSVTSTVLQSQTEYYHSVVVKNGAGNKSLSSVFSITTPAGAVPFMVIGSASSNGTASVNAVAVSGTSMYVGGTFSSITKVSDIKVLFGAKYNKTTGSIDNTFLSKFNNVITQSIVIGDYVVVIGDFTLYNGVARQYIAKISLIDGSLDTTFDTASAFASPPSCLAYDGAGYLYAGGLFSSYKGDANAVYLVKINATTGSLISEFDPRSGGTYTNPFNSAGGFPSGSPSTLAVSNGFLYIGGGFTRYQGVDAKYLVKVSATTGARNSTFNTTSGFNSPVTKIAISGSSLYAAGSFSTYQGVNYYGIVKIDTSSSAPDSTFASGIKLKYGASPGSVASLVVDGNDIIISGNFITYDNTTRAGLAKLNGSTAALITAFGDKGLNTTVGLALDGSDLYYNGLTNNSYFVRKCSSVTGVDDATFSVGALDGYVGAVALHSNGIFMGGSFRNPSNINNAVSCTNLVKISTQDASVDATFNTTSSGPNAGVRKIILDGSYLYLLGAFTAYKGSTRNYLAKVSASTAALDNTFDSSTTFNYLNISSMILDSGYLYVAGDFGTYKGTTRQGIAKINATDASLDSTFNSASGFGGGSPRSLAIYSGSIYVVGGFTTYKGTTRNYMVKIDSTTAALDSTFDSATTVSGSIDSVLPTPSGLFIGGNFINYKGAHRRGIAKVNLNNAAVDSTFDSSNFSYSGGQSVSALALDEAGNLLLGGSFANGLAKLNSSTAALVTGFVPGTSRNVITGILRVGDLLIVTGSIREYGSVLVLDVGMLDSTTAQLVGY
jgi:hypothetical protein